MQPAAARRAGRYLRIVGVVAFIILALAFLRSIPIRPTAAVRAQGDNCITSTNTIPPTPLPNATSQPTATAGGPYSGSIGNPILFLGSGTPSRDATLLTCIWSFGDGATSNFLTPTHVYDVSGVYTATLTITDSSGATATASATVNVGGFVPLCQQPSLTGNNGLNPCTFVSTCGAASPFINNNCETICGQTGEALAPGNCPGPSTGNQITINGPFNVQIEQPVTVSADLNVGAFSDLAVGDVVTFNFGDGAVVTNSGAGSAGTLVTTTTSTTSSIGSNSSQSTTSTVGAVPNLPAGLQATHAYTQAGTYTITASVLFSNGTSALAKTTATVTGAQALPTVPPTATPAPPAQITVPLATGCNQVTLTFPGTTPVTTVAGALQGVTLVSIYEVSAGAPILGYFPEPTAPSNLVSVQHGDRALICVRGTGALTEPAH